MEYRENCLTYEEYVTLRNSVGWRNFSDEQVSHSLNNNVYDITVVENDETIAMGRLIGDGLYYLIVDIVVNPEFQGKGIGSKIIDMLLAYVDDSTPVGGRSSVQLISERGKEAFYLKKVRPAPAQDAESPAAADCARPAGSRPCPTRSDECGPSRSSCHPM